MIRIIKNTKSVIVISEIIFEDRKFAGGSKSQLWVLVLSV